jgi:bifunctional DNA-binding transcriptional regulator/antitoxin component of YhaV-PrlF toxin-antitoxin module
MPELINNYNCLLGNSSKQIVELINRSVKDKIMIKKIGLNAKKTFFRKYSSKIIFNKILKEASCE